MAIWEQIKCVMVFKSTLFLNEGTHVFACDEIRKELQKKLDRKKQNVINFYGFSEKMKTKEEKKGRDEICLFVSLFS